LGRCVAHGSHTRAIVSAAACDFLGFSARGINLGVVGFDQSPCSRCNNASWQTLSATESSGTLYGISTEKTLTSVFVACETCHAGYPVQDKEAQAKYLALARGTLLPVDYRKLPHQKLPGKFHSGPESGRWDTVLSGSETGRIVLEAGQELSAATDSYWDRERHRLAIATGLLPRPTAWPYPFQVPRSALLDSSLLTTP
jgi:hypothetical protein